MFTHVVQLNSGLSVGSAGSQREKSSLGSFSETVMYIKFILGGHFSNLICYLSKTIRYKISYFVGTLFGDAGV